MSARFISASLVVAGYHSVTIALPEGWRPGDVFVTMLFTPTGAPTLPGGWLHAQTYNYFKVAGASESAVTVTTGVGLVAGTIALYREVDTRAGYLPGQFSNSAFPEYGGALSSPGTYYPPDRPDTPKFTQGVCPFSLGPALSNGGLAIATYQSESSESSPFDTHYVSAGALVERFIGYVAMVDPDTGNTCHFRLGFYDAPLAAGAGTGNLYWGTTGTGGGQRANGTPYTGPVSWFSQLILNGSAIPVPDLTAIASPVVGGETTISMTKAAGATVTVVEV